MPSKTNGVESAEQFANRINAKFGGNKINAYDLFQKVEGFLGRFVCYPQSMRMLPMCSGLPTLIVWMHGNQHRV
jgi:hypothetical protein